MSRPPVEEPRFQAAVAALHAALGEAAFAAAWQCGLALTPEQAAAEAVAVGPTPPEATPPV
jgi:hypothetical protein